MKYQILTSAMYLLCAQKIQANTVGELQKIIAVQQTQIEELKLSLKGLIGQFSSSCPAGWLPADGREGRIDLRGVFLRGINDFGTGSRSDSFADADNRTAGSFQAESFKSHSHISDKAGSHSHNLSEANEHSHEVLNGGEHSHSVQGSPYTHRAYGGVNNLGMWKADGSVTTSSTGSHRHSMAPAGKHSHTISSPGEHVHSIAPSGGAETRPNNVGVIFCIKV